MTKFKVVHVEAERSDSLPIEKSALAKVGVDLICGGISEPDRVVAEFGDADILLVDSLSVSRELIEGLTRCQAVICYSIGVDHIDLNAATEHGILIVNTPGFCTEEVANHTILFILACARRLVQFDRNMRKGRWPEGDTIQALEKTLLPMGSLYGEQLGLVGFGNIAQSVAVKAQVFGLQVCAYDPFVDAGVFEKLGVAQMSLDELIQSSDYLSLHAPLTPETRHLIDAERLERMKRSAFLINTSRGATLDQTALVQALQKGWIAGAALDVFEKEPLSSDNPLLGMENVILTPHTGFSSNGSFYRFHLRVGEEAARIASGKWPTAIANPEVKGRSRFEQNQPNLN